ncbi:MAG TPA: PAS domain S-box protein, partial [Abditibacterium sp.]
MTGAVSVATDITQRKHLEDAQAQLAAIVESAGDAIFSTALNGNILTWNRGAQELFGYSPEEALGCSLALIFPSHTAPDNGPPDSTAPTLGEILERIRRGEVIANLEIPLARKIAGTPNSAHQTNRRGGNRRRFPARDGEGEQVWLSISPIFDAAGTLIGASGIARDISEQKRAGEASRRNEKLYRALTSNFPNGAVYLLDLEGRFFLAEGRGLATIGLSSEQFVGKTLDDVFGDIPAGECIRWIFERAVQGHETASELEIHGRMRAVRGVPVLDDEGRTSFVLAMSQDITEQKGAEIALAESEMRLRALVASMDEVVFQFAPDGTYLNIWTNDETRLLRPKSEMIGHRIGDMKGNT